MTRLADSLIGELTQEAGTTRRVLERVPEQKMSWKPHVKSMSLGQLAHHVAFVTGAIAELVSEDTRELPTVPRPEAKSVAELLATLEESVAKATRGLSSWSDEVLMRPFRLTRNGQTVMELPRIVMIRAVMLNHWYHHRGQLTVYLRLLDVPVPPVYGGSADDPAF